MEDNPSTTPDQLMKLDNRKVFETSKYKPK
jgi:hypothetical protein